MKRRLSLLLLLVLGATSLRAQFEGSISMRVSTYYEAETTRVAYVMSVKNDMLAVTTSGGTTKDAAEGGHFIIRGDKRLMWIVNDAERKYVEFPLLDDTTAKKPAGTAKSAPAEPLLRKTGKSKTLLGYACDEYAGATSDETSVIWASPKLGKVYDGLFKSLNQMKPGEAAAETGGDWQAELVRLKLFPLSITTRRNGALYETQEVTAISSKPPSPGAFAPPAGFEKLSMENEFQNMLRQMQEQMKNEEGSSSDTSRR
jgi:hypothetical protein